jgi:hypothetical protein
MMREDRTDLGSPEIGWFELCCDWAIVQRGVVSSSDFSRWDVSDRFEHSASVEPVYRFDSSFSCGLERPPWSASVDYLGFVGSADSLGRGIVAAISHVAHQKLDACLD